MSSDAPSSAGHRERLRQRLLTAGGEGFHDYELLEYLLALAIPRQDTKPLAKRLIEEFGSLAALMLRPIGTLSMLGLMLHGAMGRLGEAAIASIDQDC